MLRTAGHIQGRVGGVELLATVAVLSLFTACGFSCSRPQPTSAPRTDAAADEPSFAVQVVEVQRGEIAQTVTAPGSVVARRESRIGTEVPGRILRILVSEGDRVDAGAPLFQIDPAPYEMAVRQAEAGLDVSRAGQQQIEADLERARSLRKQAVVPQQELDRLQTQLAVAQAQGRQAAEALALARFNLARTTVPSPYSGSVAQRLVDEGTTALAQPQTIVVVIQETAELEAHAAIPESQLASVHIGDTAIVSVEGVNEPVQTTVSAVSDTIDPATRTYLVKARVPNLDRILKAGVFAQVEIRPQPKRGVLLVPREAVRTEDGRTRVMVLRDGRSEAVNVEVGLVSEQVAEVVSGLSEGTPVLVGAAARTMAPGMRVHVAEAAATGPRS